MSGKLAVTASVGVSGPLAEGTSAEILDRYAADVRQAIGDRAVRLLGAVPMDKSGRAHGNFRAHLRAVPRGNTVAVPGPMIKGQVWSPWLEGTSKRNESTGFPGYRLFRRTRLELDRQAGPIAEDVLEKYLPQLGGK